MCKTSTAGQLIPFSSLQAKSARLDPLDAVNVIANRGAGSRFYAVAQSFRHASMPLSEHCKCSMEIASQNGARRIQYAQRSTAGREAIFMQI